MKYRSYCHISICLLSLYFLWPFLSFLPSFKLDYYIHCYFCSSMHLVRRWNITTVFIPVRAQPNKCPPSNERYFQHTTVWNCIGVKLIFKAKWQIGSLLLTVLNYVNLHPKQYTCQLRALKPIYNHAPQILNDETVRMTTNCEGWFFNRILIYVLHWKSR